MNSLDTDYGICSVFGCLPLDQCIDCLTYFVWHFLSVMSRLFPSCLVIVMSLVFLQSMFLPVQPDYLEILVSQTRKEVACPPLTITLTDRTCDSFCTSLFEWIKRDLESDDKEKRRGMRGTQGIFLLSLTRLLSSFPFLPIEGKEAVLLFAIFSLSSCLSFPLPDLQLSCLSSRLSLSSRPSSTLFDFSRLPSRTSFFLESLLLITYSLHASPSSSPSSSPSTFVLLDSTSNGWCSHFGLSQLHPSCSFLLCLFFMYPYSILQVFLFCLFLLFSSQGIRDPSSVSFFHSASIRQQTTSGMK